MALRQRANNVRVVSDFVIGCSVACRFYSLLWERDFGRNVVGTMVET